ncbi:MAG: ankyrin repeat domain-containing protein [Chloroflexi bacterium]|nr:MAG: ankyrin repeat domain-containing protein [Chloroflexota bacterium]MBL1195246.1 ankyrin repeat domain-containing protein [Chloroflexota bacterium]NOH12532.1 ankyrin repeat domain-containing protein [Chloroflexota bacterium]
MSDAPERLPALDPELSRAFVIAAHSDLEKVQSMLAEEPRLVNATIDWGGGDFESAIGGAAHTGGKAIAEFLLANGARMDLPVAVMLNKLEVVKAIVAAFPGSHKVSGAHGIPLSVHARQGNAQEVLAYLESLD